ncbi:DUF1622 domain-containing protein [Enterococcus sp. DIV0242_7C1]|uniref:DUF1622 domain-containing protein n=2 Tax=Enterococcus TaxID=1350 RepID=A0A200J7C6_9ENTE|nr:MULTISPECIES: DUF1622 domain-containing protein [Enterococcus]MBO0471578.1 DUF1622 domain-containing protein [Enterococcus sp. DIV0242_7C1]MCA5011977.1 DUF1622 domain-containing protein [Enterococcus sp. S23]MCA5015228.1 DUF1622 domain-containing protein [Enterococcus sp. S22(2020)]OUZ32741.1 hypothetical protein A5889_001450 [Enterococcus sp. 9D6_DIV0238]GGC96765.1 membrane protein [Enterococcus wangshanyuanii]
MHDLAQTIMNDLIPFFDLFILALNVFSIAILVWGVIVAGIDFVKSERTNRNRIVMTRQNNFIKSFLGSYILLSLEILIAADIIESIIKPTFQDILKLAILVVIRTVISYFLHKEIEDALKDKEVEIESAKK